MKKFSILLIVIVIVFAFDFTSFAENLPESAEDGTMLHAHTWSFNSVEENMQAIAEAGFNSVQVSPVQKTKDSSPWWILYQPCNLHIGNHLGTYDDFVSMCNTAENYDVKIIVDAVLNHVGDNGTSNTWADELDPLLKNYSYFHNNGTIASYTDRWQLTQQDLLGMPDWNTQNTEVQNLHMNFLNECILAGADGFRFDAAKHIETSSGEDYNWKGDYWENVLGGLYNKDSIYCFGEVLPDLADNDEKYLEYFDITAHGYGQIIRSAVRDLNVTNIEDIWHGDHTLNPSKSLAYIENHDDYESNADNSIALTKWQRKMGYSIIAARAQLSPRLMDRPEDDIWKDSEIEVINNFHNAMVGENEYLRYPRGETLVVDRGDRGTAIINLGENFYIDSDTNLEDGVYSGSAGTFNVVNGKITGNVSAKSVITIYDGNTYGPGNSSSEDVTTTIKIQYDVGYGNSVSLRGSINPLSWDTGQVMTCVDEIYWVWSTTLIPDGESFEFKGLINDSTWEVGDNHVGIGGQTITVNGNF